METFLGLAGCHGPCLSSDHSILILEEKKTRLSIRSNSLVGSVSLIGPGHSLADGMAATRREPYNLMYWCKIITNDMRFRLTWNICDRHHLVVGMVYITTTANHV